MVSGDGVEKVGRFWKSNSVRFAVIEILESSTFDFVALRQVNRGQMCDFTSSQQTNIAPGFFYTNQENYA